MVVDMSYIKCSRCTPSLEFPGFWLRFLQVLTYNCLTMRESTLVSIHETVVTVYMRALSHCHAISQLQQWVLNRCYRYPLKFLICNGHGPPLLLPTPWSTLGMAEPIFEELMLAGLVEIFKNFEKMNDCVEKISSYNHTLRWI
ncbi:hypothetical protein CFP56_019470 [Quercus suber]|uniref:Uncharacterized protein n=1 Tax=Quercus suber TaxID=58331 RepID=A0AAW0KIR8_QUESU